jgi:hypothetical protein
MPRVVLRWNSSILFNKVIWVELVSRLRAHLAAQGIADVTLEHASEPPAPHPVSGKFRQVWAEPPPQLEAQQICYQGRPFANSGES